MRQAEPIGRLTKSQRRALLLLAAGHSLPTKDTSPRTLRALSARGYISADWVVTDRGGLAVRITDLGRARMRVRRGRPIGEARHAAMARQMQIKLETETC